MKLRDIMSVDVQCVQPDESISVAAKTMLTLDVGALPVCDGDRLAGIVTDRDIVTRGLAKSPQATVIRDVMTPRVTWAYDDDDVSAAAEVMSKEQIRRLPILNRDKRLVGIVSLGDLAVRTGDDPLVGRTLEVISSPNG